MRFLTAVQFVWISMALVLAAPPTARAEEEISPSPAQAPSPNPSPGPNPSASPGESILDGYTSEQRSQLLAGEPVYESVETQGQQGSLEGHGKASILIQAPAETCFRIFCEFDKMQEYFPRKKKSVVLRSEGNRFWVQKEFDFTLTTVRQTMLYTVDADAHRVDFQLAKEYPHDIQESVGYFQFKPMDEGRTLFVYEMLKTDTGFAVPGFIRRYMTSRDLPAIVENVKRRVESGGKWKKDD